MAEKDLFRELGIKVPDSLSKLQDMCQEKIRKMIDKGWDTGNDPANLATYQKWEKLKSEFLDEISYQRYLREKIMPLIKDFVVSVDLGGWIKRDELEQRVHRLALPINLENSLALRMTREEIVRLGLRLVSSAPPPEPVENLSWQISKNRMVELRWKPSKDCSHYLICKKTADNPPRTHRDGLLEKIPASVTHFSHWLSENDIGLTFCYVVFAYCEQDDSSIGQSIAIFCPGSINAGSVIASQQHNQMEISWQPLPNALGYEIEIAGKTSQCKASSTKFVPKNNIIDYRIRALFANGVKSKPATGQCKFVSPPIESPLVSLAVDQDNIHISWPALSGKRWSYRLMRSTSAKFTRPVEIYSSTGCQANDPGQIMPPLKAKFGVFYYYAVYPYHEKIFPYRDKISEKLAIFPSGPVVLPQAVSSLVAKQCGEQVEITWRFSPGSLKCHVFRGLGATMPSVAIGKKITANPDTQYCCSTVKSFYIDQDCMQGKNHYLVVAEFADGWAKPMAISVDYRLAPSAPVNFCASPAREAVKLCWEKPPGIVTGYSLYRSQTNKFSQAKLIGEIKHQDTAVWEDREIVCGHSYFYFSLSRNKETISAFPAMAGPAFGYIEVEALHIEQKQREVLLNWQNVGQSQTLLFRAQGVYSALCELKEGTMRPLAHASLIATLAKNHFCENIAPGTYSYGLAIVYPKGICLAGPVKTMHIKALPPSPLDLCAKSEDGFISLKWQSGGNSQYAILRQTNGNTQSAPEWYKVVNEPFFEDCKINPGESYRYLIYGFDGDLHSEYFVASNWQLAYRELKVEINAQPDLVELHWQRPKNAEVALYRKWQDWQLLTRGKFSGYQDGDICEGERCLYRVSCFYRKLDGSLWETPGVFGNALPQKTLETFSHFNCHRLGELVSLFWKREDKRGNVVILKAKSRIYTPAQLELARFQHLQKANSMLKISLISANNAQDIDHANSYYHPFVIFNERVYAYSPQSSRIIPEIEGVVRGHFRFEGNCPQIRLQWDWTPELERVKVCRSVDKYPVSPFDPQAESWEIEKKDYCKDGGFVNMPAKEPDGKKYHYCVYRIECGKGGNVKYSPGLADDCRIAVRYVGAKLPIAFQMPKKLSRQKLYFLWGQPLYLNSVNKFVKGDFVLAWSQNNVHWQIIQDSKHNIFEKPQGRFLLSGIARDCFVKLNWCEKKDGQYIICIPAKLKLMRV